MTTTGKERAVLGTLIHEFPEPLPQALRLLLRHAPESFDDQRHGIAATAIRETDLSGHAVNIVSVERQLDGKLGSIGGEAFLRPLLGESLPLETAIEDAETLWVAYRDRLRLRTLHD